MPEGLDIPSSSDGDDGQQYLCGICGSTLQSYEYKKSSHYQKMMKIKEANPERFEKCLELGRKYLRNIADYGTTNWYEWRCENWGTKWNAYEIEKVSGNEIKFQTAWSGVPVLVSKVASMFPAVTINYDYADEDTSYNVGSFIFKGDEVQDNSPANASPEAWKLVFDLGVAEIEDYVEQPDGTYKYKDDEDDE